MQDGRYFPGQARSSAYCACLTHTAGRMQDGRALPRTGQKQCTRVLDWPHENMTRQCKQIMTGCPACTFAKVLSGSATHAWAIFTQKRIR